VSARRLARYYDLDLALDEQADVEMYLAFAEATDGTVLELMAGTGRVAVPLAAAGHKVVAVDRDTQMLERALRRWTATERVNGGSLDLVEHDVTTLALDERFALVVVALNSLLLLESRAAQRAAVATAARHLASSGRAVIDTWLPAPEDLALYDGRLVLDWTALDDEADEWVSKTTSARYESATRVAQVTSFFDAWPDDGKTTRTLRQETITFTAADELMAMAEDAGLEIETLAGDYEMGHFAASSDRLVMVCRAATD
jgi:SAM-dependent methyltransferase